MENKRSPRNKTLTVDKQEYNLLSKRLYVPCQVERLSITEILNKTVLADTIKVIQHIPDGVFDLIVIDPPYNLDKNFHGFQFKASGHEDYIEYLESWFPEVVRTLKPSGSLYLCGDWKNTAGLHQIMTKYLTVINRITWQREKGRGAKANWKNSMEDIWFGVKNKNDYYFEINSVKQKRKVIAPYKVNGNPKDWVETDEGNYRLTYPSNFWDDISIPYWSMSENTDHPTQKPEKLIAKLILASCPTDGVVFDPFLGSGTTSVVANKLGRKYVGVEFNEEYAVWAEKRLQKSESDNRIQGYTDKVFWERNSLGTQKKINKLSKSTQNENTLELFYK